MFQLLLLFMWMTTRGCDAAKILAVFPQSGESHFAVMRTLVSELGMRGHNVTVYNTHPLGETIENVTENVTPEFPFWSNLQNHAAPKGTLLDLSNLHPDTLRKSLGAVGADALNHFLSQPSVQALLQLSSVDFDYDLVIVDLFYSEALLALGYAHSRPTIGIVSTDFGNYMDAVQESIVPSACAPIDFEEYSWDWGFWERLAVIRGCISRRKQFAKDNYDAQEQLIAKHFQLRFTPTIPQLHAQLAVLLLNNHAPLLTPRPLVPHIIPAGGLHIRAAKELPWNLKRFMEESRIGVIYMQLGNEHLCGQIPEDKRQELFKALGSRKERVVWTCHDVKTIDGLPKNVMIQHAVPPIDILAHPHIRAFIMTGDLLSLQEGIVRNVPLLGLPIFSNEKRNVLMAVKMGIALYLDNDNVTADGLNWALNELLTDPIYKLSIRDVSTEFRDRPLGALASAMFWVNYVLRHKGGAAIKTNGIGVSSSHLHLFDLFIFYIGIAVIIVGLLVSIYIGAAFLWQKQTNGKKYAKQN